MNTTFPLAIRALAAAAFAVAALFTAPEAKAELPTEIQGFRLGMNAAQARQACEKKEGSWEYFVRGRTLRSYTCEFGRVVVLVEIDIQSGRTIMVSFHVGLNPSQIAGPEERAAADSEYRRAVAKALESWGEPSREKSDSVLWKNDQRWVLISISRGSGDWGIHLRATR